MDRIGPKAIGLNHQVARPVIGVVSDAARVDSDAGKIRRGLGVLT